MVRNRRTVVPADEFWLSLEQVMACSCFEVVPHLYHGEHDASMSETYTVFFRDSDGPQSCDAFWVYFGNSVVDGRKKVYYLVDESKLTMLAAIAAIDSLMGDVVPVS